MKVFGNQPDYKFEFIKFNLTHTDIVFVCKKREKKEHISFI